MRLLYRQLIRQSGFRPKKRLGQHFLIDEAVLEHILSAAELAPGDIVIEIGSGLGVLTEGLARQGARVIAVELDARLVGLLKKRLAAFPDVRIVHADILHVTPRELLEENFPGSELGRGYKVVANLPYYITSPVLSHFLEAQPRPSKMVVMVQKEVGEAIAAGPGKMRLLSVKAQFYSRPAIVAHVPAASFSPAPKVNSVILRLDVFPRPAIEVSDVTGFFDIVIHGFSAPRKQLRNSLAHSLDMPPSEVASLLEKAGIEPKRRAETLSLEEWRELWKVFAPFVRNS
ncbi:MAG: ribosomal RNA small subunit methyltransferase A [Chloroflexi bacterium RBG_13_51_36]|nr:MAG: ribosomal RNA small subunit methyltransferase A [Chloroflexi bacterium RBG_13_51_36]